MSWPTGRVSRFVLARAVVSTLEAAGIKKQCGPFNLLRHTFGSRLAEAGRPFEVIASIMGNTPEACRRYDIRSSPGYMRAATASTDDLDSAEPGSDSKAGNGLPGGVENTSQVVHN